MDIKKRHIPLAVAVVFILLGTIYALATYDTLKSDREHAVAQANLNARVYAGELARDFDRAVAITEALEEVIINSNGHIQDFDDIAKDLMKDYIGSIQIAPNGVVTKIYPLEGNEGGLIDLMNDPDRCPIVAYGKEHDIITMQGPFELKQGGSGIAVRDPVFLTDEQGNKEFWGFTIVIIKTPDIFEYSFNSLASFGYDYRLSATASPLTDEFKMVTSSCESLDQPAVETFSEGACTWKLEVAPKGGWKTSRATLVSCLVGALFVVLLTAMFAALLYVREQRRQLRIMAETDPLTGLYNRKGMSDRVQSYLSAHPGKPATEVLLDIDDFKLVNDLHGHDVGDAALINLAKNLKKVFGDVAIISRTGGDEFGVFFPGMTAEQAEPLIHAESELDQSFTTAQGRDYTYTISMGYADYPAQAQSREELTRNVDSALYTVKLNGKHGCLRYAPGMTKQSRQQLGFTQKELLRSLPGASFICHAEDTSILYANDDLFSLLECDNYEDFNAYSKGLFRNIIHPDDFERVMFERQQKLASASPDGFICCGFRIITKNGNVRNMQAQARFKQHETFGGLFFVTTMELDGWV